MTKTVIYFYVNNLYKETLKKDINPKIIDIIQENFSNF
jgi:hypothetical protein